MSSIHFINTHKGEDHVSSDDSRAMQALVLGAGRYIAEGMTISKTGNNTVSLTDGVALLDGGWLRLQGGGENFDVPGGTIGYNRKDRVFFVFERAVSGEEEMTFRYVTGTPSTGVPPAPVNQYPGNILDGDATVWIPVFEIPLSGMTVGTPTMLITDPWTLPATTPEYENYDALVKRIEGYLTESAAATAALWEAVRIANETREAQNAQFAEIVEWYERASVDIEARVQQMQADIDLILVTYEANANAALQQAVDTWNQQTAQVLTDVDRLMNTITAGLNVKVDAIASDLVAYLNEWKLYGDTLYVTAGTTSIANGVLTINIAGSMSGDTLTITQ